MTPAAPALEWWEVECAVGGVSGPAYPTLEERARWAAAHLDALAARGGDRLLVATPTESLRSLAAMLRALADLSREATE